MKTPEIGFLGGGQLAQMAIEEGRKAIAAGRLPNMHFAVMDPNNKASAHQIADRFVVGNFGNEDNVLAFGTTCDVLTIEIERVHAGAMRQLSEQGIDVFPQADPVELIQDKGKQKMFYRDLDIPSPDFRFVQNRTELQNHSDFFPVYQKLRKGGYDGTGVKKLQTPDDWREGFDAPSIIERAVDVRSEISVLVARGKSGEVKTFPPVEMAFDPVLNLVDRVVSPSSLTEQQIRTVTDIAKTIITRLEMVGILAVEMFMDHAGNISVNEMAPRTHNSGHVTIEGNRTSQFEQHLRAVAGLPLGPTDIITPAVMINLVYRGDGRGKPSYGNKDAAIDLGGHIHLYGKTEAWDGRKLGHITVTADSVEEAHAKATEIQQLVTVGIENEQV